MCLIRQETFDVSLPVRSRHWILIFPGSRGQIPLYHWIQKPRHNSYYFMHPWFPLYSSNVNCLLPITSSKTFNEFSFIRKLNNLLNGFSKWFSIMEGETDWPSFYSFFYVLVYSSLANNTYFLWYIVHRSTYIY